MTLLPSRKLGLALLTLFLIALPLGGFYAARENARSERDRNLDRHATDLGKVLQDGFTFDVQALNAMRAFYEAAARDGRRPLALDPSIAQAFARGLGRRHSFRALSFAPRVPASELDGFTELASKKLARRFTVFEQRGTRRVPVRPRPAYYPVYAIEPVADNESAFGFDLASESNRRTTLARAIATGAPSSTAKLTLVQEVSSEPATLIFAPLYRGGKRPSSARARRSAVVGVVTGVLMIGDTTRRFTTQEQFKDINFALFDGSRSSRRSLAYSTAGQDPSIEGPTRRMRVSVAGRPWTLVAWPKPGRSEPAYGYSWLVLFLGIALAVLLLSIVIRQSRSQERELQQKNRKLEEANARLGARHGVTRALAESASVAEAMPRVLQTLAERMQWGIGAFWELDERARVLRCREIWHAPELEVGELTSVFPELTFAPGVGLPGRVWRNRAPECVADVLQDPGLLRSGVALKHGLRGALAVPIGSGTEILGVIEFFGKEIAPEDQETLEMTASIGVQIGQFMERKWAEREAERLKEEFFAMVSHELRTPLTSIIGYTDMLLDGSAGELADQQRRFLEVTSRNAARQLRLVGDLLFVSQLEAGGFKVLLQSVDLASSLRDSIEAAAPAAEERRIELSFVADELPPCPGDRDRLAQLVDNLLSNALKFAPVGGRVELRLFEAGGQAVVEVENSGSYIPPAERAELFERFFRGSNATEQIDGLGLGLAICKVIVTAHGGRIEVDSDERSGTTFRVELPLHAERSAETLNTQKAAAKAAAAS